MTKNAKILLLLIAIVIAVFIIIRCNQDSVEPAPVTTTGSLEIPTFESPDQIVRHAAYTLQYNEANEQPDWVAYYLTSSRLYGGVSRTDDFREDPMVSTGSALLDDYKYTGYDRGHMAPAGDFTWSATAMSESFYLSNMSPQIHSFNAGIWELLENQVRSWANVANDTLFIVAGPILKPGLPTIGARNKLTVPGYYFKAILRKSATGLSAIAFLMKHENSSKPLSNFAITVDSLEKVTNINFFNKLAASTQADIESRIDVSKWPGILLKQSTLKKSLSK